MCAGPAGTEASISPDDKRSVAPNTHRDHYPCRGNVVFDLSKVYTEGDTRTRRVFII